MRAVLFAILVIFCVAGAILGRRASRGHWKGALIGFLLAVVLWCALLVWVADSQIKAWRQMDQQIRKETAGRASSAVGGGPHPRSPVTGPGNFRRVGP